MVGHAVERGDRARRRRSAARTTSPDRDVVVLGSGNLGLIYLMEEPRRLTLEEIEERHPRLLPALREHPHVGWLLVRSARARRGRRSAPSGTRYLPTTASRARTRSRRSRRPRARHLRRTDGFEHVADIMVGSFYDPELDEGCAFEELISFHGGSAGRRPGRSSSTPPTCRCPSSRSSARPPSTTC